MALAECLALLLVSLACCQGQNQVELLKNPNLEQSIGSSNWECYGCTGSTVKDSYQGNTAFLASNRAQSWNGPSQKLYLGSQLKVKGRYSFSCYVKLSGVVKKPQNIAAVIRYSFTDGTADKYDGIATISKLTLDKKWHKLSSDFQLKDYGHPLKRSLLLYITNPDPGVNILLDKCSLRTTNDADWRAAARERIEQIRKGDLTVNIHTTQPLSNVVVKVKQISHEFGFGSAVAARFLQTNSNYRKWFLENFEWAVLEGDMKWRANERLRNKLTWDVPDKTMKILEDNGKKVRGHAIFWAATERNPDWLQKITNKKEFYNVCMKRVEDVVSRYKGRLEHWDVNNEMTNHRFYADKYGSTSIRNDMFTKARSVDPNAKLFMNDYNLVDGGYNLDRFIRQAKAFQAAKVPLDGVGAQGHLTSLPIPKPHGPTILNRLDRLAEVGLPVWITELDYATKDDQERADVLEDALLAFFSHRSVAGVLFWGFYENRHWRGKDAALVNGLDMKPNAAGLMWQRLFHKDWRSNMEVKMGNVAAGKKATSSNRVFYGHYEVSISTNGVTLHTEKVRVGKGQPEVINVQLTQNVIG